MVSVFPQGADLKRRLTCLWRESLMLAGCAAVAGLRHERNDFPWRQRVFFSGSNVEIGGAVRGEAVELSLAPALCALFASNLAPECAVRGGLRVGVTCCAWHCKDLGAAIF